jgi:hypothetical protein
VSARQPEWQGSFRCQTSRTTCSRRSPELARVRAHAADARQDDGRGAGFHGPARLRVERRVREGLPTTGAPGFYKILDAVAVLESAGFGFGKEGSKPGTRYEYADVAARTPSDPDVNTIAIS